MVVSGSKISDSYAGRSSVFQKKAADEENKSRTKLVNTNKEALYDDGVEVSISDDGAKLLDANLNAADKTEIQGKEKEERENLNLPEISSSADRDKNVGIDASYLKEQAEAADKAAEAMEDLAKLMEIARRISNGDKVPSTDERKLMEFSSELYQSAKAAAMLNENRKHKEYDSVYDEEEEELSRRADALSDEEESSGEADAVSIEAEAPEVSAELAE